MSWKPGTDPDPPKAAHPKAQDRGALGENPRAPAGAARSRHRTSPKSTTGKDVGKILLGLVPVSPFSPVTHTPRAEGQTRDSPERENVRSDFCIFIYLFLRGREREKILSMSLKLLLILGFFPPLPRTLSFCLQTISIELVAGIPDNRTHLRACLGDEQTDMIHLGRGNDVCRGRNPAQIGSPDYSQSVPTFPHKQAAGFIFTGVFYFYLSIFGYIRFRGFPLCLPTEKQRE